MGEGGRPKIPNFLVRTIWMPPNVYQSSFTHLSLEYFLLNGASSGQSVHMDFATLSIPPNSSHGLHICGRVPVHVEKEDSRCTDQVETSPTSFGAQQQNKSLAVVGRIEILK